MTADVPERHHHVKMRRAYILGEQVVVSATIFFININASRNLGLEEFGVFALFFTAAVLAIGLQRATFFEPLLILAGRTNGVDKSVVTYSAVGSTILGVVAALAAAACMWWIEPRVTSILCSILIVGPFLQDAVRMLCLVLRGPVLALIASAANAALQIGGAIVMNTALTPSFPTHLGVWGGASLSCSLVFAGILIPKIHNLRKGALPPTYKRQARSFGADYFLGILALQSTLGFATATGGPAAAAALRGADALVGPIRVVLQSLPQLLLRNWSSHTRNYLLRACYRGAGLATLPISIAALIAAILPHNLGELLMGESWQAVQPVLPYVIIALIPIVMSQLSALALKSIGANRYLLSARIATVPITLICGTSGALMGAAMGAAIGSLTGSVLASCIYFITLRRALTSKGEIEQ